MADMKAVRAKLGQARAHAQRFDTVAQEIFNRRPFELCGGTEDEWFVMRWKQNGEYPDFEPLSLIFGDILYNLRASLDYLAWQLVLANGEQPTRQTCFACVRNIDDWSSAVGSQLRGIAPSWVSEIKNLQPFDPSHTSIPETHMLAILDDANNVNKHRLLPLAVVTPSRVIFQIADMTPGVTVKQEMAGEQISDGALYGRFIFDQPAQVTVILDPNPIFRLRFSGIADADWRNWDLINWVEDSIKVFEPAFA